MQTLKHIALGAMMMLLVVSLALNAYQFGQMQKCVVIPDTIKPINLK